MSRMRDVIIDLIRDQVVVSAIGIVQSVNKTKNTCSVLLEAEETTLPEVRLTSIVATVDNPVVFYPAQNSYVAVAPLFNSRQHWCVMAMSEVEEVRLRGNEFGGLVKVEPLVDRMNSIEDKLNSFIQKWNAFAASYTPGSPSTVGTPPTLASSSLTPIDSTQKTQIENERVKHG